MEKILKSIIRYLLFITVSLMPLFFLPITQEFFITNKLYLLSFGMILILLISNLQFLISKKLVWKSSNFDTPLILFLLTIGLSIIFSSPNKTQAILNLNFGLLMIFSLLVLYFFLSRSSSLSIVNYSLVLSSFILSTITIIFFFQPFKNINLPTNFQFLKNPDFTPFGNRLDLAIFLGFFIIWGLAKAITEGQNPQETKNKNLIINYSLLTINLIALSLTLYQLLKPISINPGQLPQSVLNNLPPFRLSWYAAIETLKNPLTALFGVGVDNFSSIFTRIKDIAYNQSIFWQIGSFNLSRSTFLHILTETGLFGIVTFTLILLSLLKTSLNPKEKLENKAIIYYLLIIIFFLPPSFVVFFLLFLTLSKASQQATADLVGQNGAQYDLSQIPPVYLSISVLGFLIIGILAYFLGRSYLAEIYFKRSLDGFVQKNDKQVYDNMLQAIITNPYIERFRINFSQINLLIANNLASKQPKEITDEDRQNISQAIQAAIAHSKDAVTLNPQRAGNWENLAVIYRNIINVAQGADVWTISSYQRAIVADPQNPIYRLNLGGVYFSLGNYEEASKLFEQTIALKPDWPNAHYNLAWSDYQRGNYQRATNSMQNVLNLLNPQKDKVDYEKAKKELEEFKKKLPSQEGQATPSAEGSSQLSLPTPPATIMEPKIELPKEASPEANLK